MKKEKREKIEEQLRQIIAQENQSRKKITTAVTTRSGVRIIRRRKGHPDMKII